MSRIIVIGIRCRDSTTYRYPKFLLFRFQNVSTLIEIFGCVRIRSLNLQILPILIFEYSFTLEARFWNAGHRSNQTRSRTDRKPNYLESCLNEKEESS